MFTHFHTLLGVPVLKYRPPKVNVEYGGPAQSLQQSHIGNHYHHQQINHGQNSLSFFDQLKQTFGFGPSQQQSYPSHQNHVAYGPPPQAPVNHFLPPKPHNKYGVPTKPYFPSKPSSIYGK